MARVKRAAPRAPPAQPLRRSGRNQAVVRPPATTSSNPPVTIELEDDSVSPIRGADLVRRRRLVSIAEKELNAEREQTAKESTIAPFSSTVPPSLSAIILHPRFADQVSIPPVTIPVSSTKVWENFFQTPTTRLQHFFEETEEEIQPQERPQINLNESPVNSPLDGLMHNEFTQEQREETEPVLKYKRKRKGLGKTHAVRTRTSPRKKLKVSEKGDSSRAKTGEGCSPAAATVQQEQPKKAKGKEKLRQGTEADFVDKPKAPNKGFSSKAAIKCFPKFQAKVGLPDRGFDEHSMNEHFFIREAIETHGLEKVAVIYSSYNLNLIREFYCELFVTESPKLKVRGVEFMLTSKKINKFLNLPSPKKTEYHKLTQTASIAELAEVVALLGRPNADWEPHANYMLRSFKSAYLNAKANVMMNFIKHSIDPTTHDSTISVERMLLLYCLVSGRSINFGRVMLKSMRRCSTMKRGKLYFPGMLTKFLIQKGVPQYTEDVIVKEQREPWNIDMKTVSRLSNRKDKTVSASELVGLVKDLLEQNTNMMEEMNKQRREWGDKMDEICMEVKGLIEGEKKRAADLGDLEDKVKQLKEEVEQQKARNERLKERNAALEAATVLSGAAAAHEVSTFVTTNVVPRQPTPHE